MSFSPDRVGVQPPLEFPPTGIGLITAAAGPVRLTRYLRDAYAFSLDSQEGRHA